MGEFLIFIGGAFLVAALVIPIALYRNDCERRGASTRSLVLFLFGFLSAGAAVCAIFLYVISPILGASCASDSCHWIIALVGAPVSFFIGVVSFLYFWWNHNNNV